MEGDTLTEGFRPKGIPYFQAQIVCNQTLATSRAHLT